LKERHVGYSPKDYWNEVGAQLGARDEQRVIAGDASPFYAMKRALLTDLLLAPVLREGTSALEVGSGPGGNIETMLTRGTTAIGVDLSTTMLQAARARGLGRLAQADGCHLPIRSRSVDMSIVVTVLQHNPDPDAAKILGEVARVSRREVHLFEDTSVLEVHDRESHWLRKPRWYVAELHRSGFDLVHRERLRLMLTELCSVAVRALGPRRRHEGAPVERWRLRAEEAAIGLMHRADAHVPPVLGLTRLSFVRRRAEPASLAA
jgi:SAM-dependent methyltransferase